MSEPRTETQYPGQHDDCIATVPHFHQRPYKAGEWSGGVTTEGLREALEAWERNGAPNRKSLAAFGLRAVLSTTPPGA